MTKECRRPDDREVCRTQSFVILHSSFFRHWSLVGHSSFPMLPDMKYRRLGKTNLTVSVIGVGTWQFGGEWGKNFTQDEVDRMFARGRDLGMNLIDTAECYGDHLSESLIGRAIQCERDKWVLATKFGHKFNGLLKRIDQRTAADVRRQLEDSLRALRTDYVDLYQFH